MMPIQFKTIPTADTLANAGFYIIFLCFHLISDPQEVKLVKKEHFNGWYNLIPYYGALTVSKLPVQVTLNVIFSTIVFFMVGVPYSHMRFLVFCLIGNVVSLVAEGIGMAIGSIFSIRVSNLIQDSSS